MNPQKTARIAGLLYPIMFPLGMFTMAYVHPKLLVPGDAVTTANNIMAFGSLFRLSIVSALIIQVVNIFVVLVLFKLLKQVNKNLALLMVIFILLGVPIQMFNQLNHSATLILLSGADYLTAFGADQLQALVPLFLDLYDHGIEIAGIFWGLWLFPMGYLVYRSGYLPRILGVLLIIGGFGYLIESVTTFLFPNFEATIGWFTFWGEILFPLWLLIKGVNVEAWEKRALESA